MKFDIFNSTKKINNVMKANTPELMIFGGIVGLVVAGGLACKATLKSKEVIDEHNECLEDVKNDVDISEEEKKKIVTTQYVITTKELVKNYAPAVLLGTASATLIIAANNEQRKRQAYLISAYTAVDSAFKKYRAAVIEEQGEEKDIQYRHGIVKRKIEEIVTDEETGKEKKVKSNPYVMPEGYDVSEYAKFFDESCPDWSKNPESNLLFLKLQESYATDKLKIQGHLFLNEVYDMIGIPRTEAGAVVGWLYDEKNPIGDNFVSFGIYDIKREKNRDFVNGYEPSILLDFNVDGVIYNKI